MEEKFNFICFWYLNDKNTLCIDNLAFIEFLHEVLGFCNSILHGHQQLVRVENNGFT